MIKYCDVDIQLSLISMCCENMLHLRSSVEPRRNIISPDIVLCPLRSQITDMLSPYLSMPLWVQRREIEEVAYITWGHEYLWVQWNHSLMLNMNMTPKSVGIILQTRGTHRGDVSLISFLFWAEEDMNHTLNHWLQNLKSSHSFRID